MLAGTVEVFRTNVRHAAIAAYLAREINLHFPGYTATFDLEDCDRILRVKSPETDIQADQIIRLLRENGFEAQVLPD